MWFKQVMATWRRRWWPETAPRFQAVPHAGAPGRQSAPMVDPFAVALARLAAAPDGGAGRLRVVSLTDFRQAVGSKWTRLADKVAMIAEAVIRRRLTPGNLYRRLGDDLWLLAFVSGDSAMARDVTFHIARDLSHHLLGDTCIGGERPLAVVAHVAAGQALNRAGVVDELVVRGAIEESRSLLEVSESNGPAGPSWRPLPRLDGGAPVGMGWQTIRLDRPASAPEEPWSTVMPLPADARLRLLWRPTWVADGEAISAYCARVVRVDHDGEEPLEGALAYPAEDALSAARLDRFVAASALRDLQAAHAAGHRASIIMPFSWTTLHLHGGQLLQPFAELSEEMRRDWVRIEVFRIPDDATAEQMEAVTAFSRRLCGDVLLRLRLGSPLVERFDASSAGHVGLDLSELRANEHMNDDQLLAALEGLQDCALRAGAGCYLWSARRRRVIGGAVRNGFEMVNGPGLMRDVGRPAAVLPAPRRRFVGAPCAPA